MGRGNFCFLRLVLQLTIEYLISKEIRRYEQENGEIVYSDEDIYGE